MRSTGAMCFTVLFRFLIYVQQVAAQPNIDGGRSQLPGMRQDMFDQAQQKKKMGGRPSGKGPPDCPKSDQMSPFWGMAWGSGEIFVKLNSSKDKCSKLITIGGANYTTLQNASRTCGPRGEWKKRISENLSAIFFQGGFEWVKSENETIEVVTEDGTFEVPVTEERHQELLACYWKGCDCEQVQNPAGRAVLLALAAIAVIGFGSDVVRWARDKFADKKPPKHVLSPKGHKMVKKACSYRICDVSGKKGTHYTCSGGSNYDLSQESYKAAKKKLKADLESWYERHPEEKKKDQENKAKKGEKDGSDDDDVSKKPENEKSDGEATKSESEKADASGDDKSEFEDKSEKEDKSEAEDKSEKES